MSRENELFTTVWPSPLGALTLVSDGEALTALRFDSPELPGAVRDAELPVFRETVRWLETYFAGKDPGFTPKLALRGTAFQKIVWALLLGIPYGQTTTYGALAKEAAKRLGVRKMSAQAVGGAVGRNPVALIVPCHRVIGSDGRLTGYAAGHERKQKLLTLEQK